MSFLRFYCVSAHSGWIVFSKNKYRHSLVETGGSAVLMTMSFKMSCPLTIHKAKTDLRRLCLRISENLIKKVYVQSRIQTGHEFLHHEGLDLTEWYRTHDQKVLLNDRSKYEVRELSQRNPLTDN